MPRAHLRRVLVVALVVASAAAASWALHARSARDPYAHVLPRGEALRDDAALQRTLGELTVQDRNLLRLWIAYNGATHGAASLTIREAIAEVKERARKEPALRAAVELYTAQKPTLTSVSVDALSGRTTP